MVRREKKIKKDFIVKLVLLAGFGLFAGVVLFLIILLRSSPIARFKRKNIVIFSKNRRVLLLSYQGGEGFFLLLDPKMKVQVARGFGEYELGNVYELGELEGKGSLLVKDTFLTALEIPLVGVLYDSGEVNFFEEKNFSKIFKKVTLSGIKGKIKTDLKAKYILRLWLELVMMDKKKFRAIEFNSKSLGNLFADVCLREEGVSIEVLNSTGHSGLAQKYADFLEKVGGRVVRVGEYDFPFKNCVLRFEEKNRDLYALFWIGEILGCKRELVEKRDARSEITLILGEEDWKRMYEKW